MTEAEAKALLSNRFNVSRETYAALECFAELVIQEAHNQNLISAASIPQIWTRHILDSAQLVPLAPAEGMWIDLGAGAGFPGIVVALLRPQPTILVESRRKRIDFLQHVIATLGLRHASVFGGRVETMPTERAAVISARAFAPLAKTLAAAKRFAADDTVLILPKGQSAHEELEAIYDLWHGAFHVEQSISESQAAIIVARNVRPRGTI